MHRELMLDAMPPCDLDAECQVVGAALIDPSRLDELAEAVRPDQFHDRGIGVLYGHLLAMRETDEPIDGRLLLRRLSEAGDLDRIGGVARLDEIVQAVPTAAYALNYAARVAERARQRALVDVGYQLIADASQASGIDEAMERAERGLAAIATNQSPREPVVMRRAVCDALANIDAVMRREKSAGLLTGLQDIDQAVGGLFPGELNILAARPGQGKTSLACQVARHVAGKGKTVLFVSLEMSSAELATRMLAGDSGVSNSRIRTGDLSTADMALLADASRPLADAAMHVLDRASVTVVEIRRWVRRMARMGLSLVVVDYLQRLHPSDRRLNRYEQVGEDAKALKELAREVNVPVLCLAQLSREADKDSRPRLSHLRESGNIEQEADMVWMVRIKSPKDAGRYSPDELSRQDHEASLYVEKNRNGTTGEFSLTWIPYRTRFDCRQAAQEWLP